MFKILGIVLAGVFLGAALAETLRQFKPGVLESAEKKAGDLILNFKSAFKEGYGNTVGASAGEPV